MTLLLMQRYLNSIEFITLKLFLYNAFIVNRINTHYTVKKLLRGPSNTLLQMKIVS